MQQQPIGTILAQDTSNPPTIEGAPMAEGQPALEQEVAELIVEALNLEMAASEIDPQAPLFGEGLGLDSIDILEVALVVSKKYGFQLRSDDNNNTRIFHSLRSLCQHIALNRLK
jgi:acyl carrier protein